MEYKINDTIFIYYIEDNDSYEFEIRIDIERPDIRGLYDFEIEEILEGIPKAQAWIKNQIINIPRGKTITVNGQDYG